METKFPIESDFAKYFIYELYLTSLKSNNKEIVNQLENARKFQECINMNRRSLRLLNCGERKKNLESFIEQNSEGFAEFKEKISQECAPQVTSYLRSKFNYESTKSDITLHQRLNNEVMVLANLEAVNQCMNI